MFLAAEREDNTVRNAFPWDDLPQAFVAILVMGIMNVVAGIVLMSLPGGWLYLIFLGLLDIAAIYGMIKHFGGWR